ncbi:MAG: N-acetylglucosamine-6-phosphate deacetylase [Tissierellia bacterium]|nr:N-acetylglucosamine-6-phosphate deacetylase [Tissierellia bacterium]
MKNFVLKGDIFLKDEIIKDGFIAVENGLIKEITDDYEGEFEDLSGYIIAPGLFDTHIHGFKGYDIMDLRAESINEISKGIVTTGVTNFLATTLTASKRDLDEAVRLVADHKGLEGAMLEGIYLEGPFFTEKHKGAQNTDYMMPPNAERVRELQEIAKGMIVKIAIAPEYENSPEFIKEMNHMGIRVSLGHSDATYREAKNAVDAGASIFVHTYNGMSGLHHRNPGMVGAAMYLKRSYSELICDGNHVHPVAAKILMDVKGRDHIALITDCMMAGGMPDGKYKLGEFEVDVTDGRPTLEGGSLAGSVLKLSNGVKNVVDWGAASMHEAINMASLVPAISMGMEDRIGSLEIGRDANIIVLDRSVNLLRTYVKSELLYKA